jgi:hypothetical protein
MPEITHQSTDDSPKYTAPTISDYGDLVELTAAATNGGFTDATFPVGTPKGSETFSGPVG